MAFTPKTPQELVEAGYVPVGAPAAGTLRRYGVPIVQSGLIKLAGTRFKLWAPRWAKRLLAEWPLDASGADYDHFMLKQVIQRMARGGDTEMVDAFLTVARLGGEEAVKKMLAGGEDTCGS